MPRSLNLDRLCVVLVSTRNPLNIGAAARAMSNFGFLQLRLVNPYDRAFREARSAVGASTLLAKAKEFKTLADAVADCTLVVGTTSARDRQPTKPLRPLPDGASRIRKQLASGRVALLFGSEKHGLSNEDFSHCHWLLRIPSRDQHASMNLGQAVAICLYELIRTAAKPAKAEKRPSSTAANRERLTLLLTDLLAATGYIGSRSNAKAEQRARELILRLALTREDSATLLGMLRQMLWKVRNP